MGYYVKITNTAIHIPHSLFPTICRHLRTSDFLDPRNMSGGRHCAEGCTHAWFAWVDTGNLIKHLHADNLPAVLEEFNFEAIQNFDEKDIVDLNFNRKTGDEETLFRYIAQVLPGTHTITWVGEDDAYYQWQIYDFKFRRVHGTITFPPIP